MTPHNPTSIINLETVLDRVQNDTALLLELLQDFERDFKAKRKAIDQALARQEFEKMQEAVHSLKGAAGNLAADPIHNSLMIVENLIKYRDVEMIREVLIDIDRQFVELQAFIGEFKKRKERK